MSLNAAPAAHLSAPLAGLACARHARTLTRTALEPWADAATVDDAVLAASELAANAIEHAPGPATLHVWVRPGWACVGVTDSAPHRRVRLPLHPAAHLEALPLGAERSRGLALVCALSGGECGALYRAATKTVWFAVAVGEREHPRPQWRALILNATHPTRPTP